MRIHCGTFLETVTLIRHGCNSSNKQSMVAMEKTGHLVRFAHGVYQVRHHVPTSNDVYAISVAMMGDEAYLRGA